MSDHPITPVAIYENIPGFPGYQSSRDGQIRRVWIDGSGGQRSKVLKPDIDCRGRKRTSLRLNGKTIKILVSRIVLSCFVGPCPDDMEACHENGDCTDNRVENLRWDTHSSNLLDRRRHGTNVQGEMVHTAKLTEDDVREIRRVGYPLRQHAEKYGVTQTLVSYILKRKVWQHVN